MNHGCEYYHELAALLPDGELSPEEEASLHSHAASCPSCRQRIADYGVLSLAMREDVSGPPDTLIPSVLSKLPAQKRRPRQLRFLPGVAAAVVLLAVTMAIFRYGDAKRLSMNPAQDTPNSNSGAYSFSAGSGSAALPEGSPATPPGGTAESPQYAAEDSGANSGTDLFKSVAPEMVPQESEPTEVPAVESADAHADESTGATAGRRTEPVTEAYEALTSDIVPEPEVAQTSAPAEGEYNLTGKSNSVLPAEIAPVLPDESEYLLCFVAQLPVPDGLPEGKWNGASYYVALDSEEAFNDQVGELAGERRVGTGKKYFIVFTP